MDEVVLSDSILITIKQHLGVVPEDHSFDSDIIMDINTALAILVQEGVGPAGGFAIRGETETWEDFIGFDPRFSMAKTDVYLRTKLMFDPPLTSSVAQSMKAQSDEYEWRMNIEAENDL